MTRLGGIDANFLYFETPETPMHVAGFTLFDLPEGYAGSFHDNYRDMLASRLHLIPIFSKKLAPTLLDIHLRIEPQEIAVCSMSAGVALAADGLQGLERLQQERPALVLSDIEMPRMDGFDFLRNIRANAEWRELPVVMITSRTAEKHQDHARQLGANHYLGKPYSEDELLGLIRGYARAVAAQPVA